MNGHQIGEDLFKCISSKEKFDMSIPISLKFIPKGPIYNELTLVLLTHLPLDKMAAISQTIFRFIFVNENFYILIKILLKFVSKGPLDNNPALV